MKRAEIFRQIREIEADLQHRNPDWRERMAAWEEQVAGDQPDWIVVRPEVDEIRPAAQKYSAAGRRLVPGPGLCADQAHASKMTVKTERAERSRPSGWSC